MKNLIVGISLFIVGQSLIWFQTNGQFIWPWFKRNPLAISLIAGTGISYMFIYATRMVAEHYDGLLWPGRFIAQATGIVTFAALTFVLLSEGLSTKTIISLSLAIAIIAIQLLWK
jgi:hypothetical protein